MKDHALIWLSVILYMFAQAADIVTTFLSVPSTFEESNDFVRNGAHMPILVHVIVVKLLISVPIALFALVTYFGLRRSSRIIAQAAASAPFLFWSMMTLGTVVENLLIHLAGEPSVTLCLCIG
jgi:hypothetical protein